VRSPASPQVRAGRDVRPWPAQPGGTKTGLVNQDQTALARTTEGAGRPGGPVLAGLTTAQARERAAAGQANAVPAAPGRSVRQILRANVCTRFNAILGTLFGVVLVVGPPQDALFGLVLAANTAIGVAQELRAKRTLDRLAVLTAARARVVRDGTATEIGVDEIVRDDLIILRPGDQAAVDAVVVRSDGLEADESLLSGEAEPVAKQPGDRVLSGSFAVAGTGWVRAAEVGEAAYAVRLQAQARRFSLIRSELQQGTNQILRLVTWVMVPAGLLLILSQLLRSQQSVADAVRGSVAGVGAMVPEGLVLLTSVAFAVGAMRLARRRVLTQELAAIEGLARVDVLCIDKTGTLTAPGMQLTGIEPAAGWSGAEIEAAVGAMAAADPAPNATLQALAARCHAPAGWAVLWRVPFSSARQWSSVSFAGHGTWLLGAPGVVGRELPAGLAAAAAGHQAAGRRVLVLGRIEEEEAGGQVRAGQARVAGLLVLAERLRDGTRDTVSYLLDQGITIKVLSGDAPATVAAVAAAAGIPAPQGCTDASGAGDDEASVGAALAATSLLGRVRPAQKLAAVRALQAAGHVVAMIGDGVNDVQALKQADLGIAMGSGSQASRSVARIVLLDSAFAVVPRILAEGRRVIANIERVARLFVTKTVYAAVLAVAIGIAGDTFPFFPRHLTIVSTLAIGIPGFFLALSAGAPRAQAGFTRRVLTFAVPAGIATAPAVLASYALARTVAGVSMGQARTAALLTLLAVSGWVLILIARPLNPARVALVAGLTAAVVLLFAIPFARDVFSLRLPPALATIGAFGSAALAIAVLTLWRWAAARYLPGRWHLGGQ
jgi:cation-transporting P-type ATPase E